MISKGIILLKLEEEWCKSKVLMVERQYTYGYIDYIRSGPKMANKDFTIKVLSETTQKERTRLLIEPFKNLWFSVNSKGYKFYREEIFEKVRSKWWFKTFLQKDYKEPMWEFPKGRSNKDEDDITTALRELKEETSIESGFTLTQQKIEHTIIDRGVFPLLYFVAITDKELELNKDCIDKVEISDVKWIQIGDLKNLNGGELALNLLKMCKI